MDSPSVYHHNDTYDYLKSNKLSDERRSRSHSIIVPNELAKKLKQVSFPHNNILLYLIGAR